MLCCNSNSSGRDSLDYIANAQNPCSEDMDIGCAEPGTSTRAAATTLFPHLQFEQVEKLGPSADNHFRNF